MSPLDARVVHLVAEIRRNWQLIEDLLCRAKSVDSARGGPEAAYVALPLDHAYQAFESILLRI